MRKTLPDSTTPKPDHVTVTDGVLDLASLAEQLYLNCYPDPNATSGAKTPATPTAEGSPNRRP